MDGWILTLFVLAAFAGGFVSGFSGFAMGLVVSGVWLHIITPIQTAALIAGYGLLTQGYGILKLRQALDWQKIWPLSLGTTIGGRSSAATSGLSPNWRNERASSRRRSNSLTQA